MVTIEEKQYAGIPCYEIAEPGCVPQAELLLYHGWGSNAEKQQFRGQLLAGFGYRVIVPEISGHGRRGQLEYDEGDAALDFLRVLAESIEECAAISEAVFTPQRAHFLVGHSLGGMIVLGALAALHDVLNGVVALNSTANWTLEAKTLGSVFRDGERASACLASEEAAQLQARLAPSDPARWPALGVTTPVLLTNGSLDHTLPASLNAEFLARCPLPQVRQVIIDDAGHVVTDSALREVVGFIESNR